MNESRQTPSVSNLTLTADDYMIDIETLGTRPGAPILSIGACSVLNPSRQFVVVIENPFDEMDKPDADTFRWWLKQSEHARNALCASGTVNMRDALKAFAYFIAESSYDAGADRRVWSYGASFDITLLEVAYVRNKIPVPWSHKAPRCLRTVFAIFGKPDLPHMIGTAHSALDDALYQAAQLRTVAGVNT